MARHDMLLQQHRWYVDDPHSGAHINMFAAYRSRPKLFVALRDHVCVISYGIEQTCGRTRNTSTTTTSTRNHNVYTQYVTYPGVNAISIVRVVRWECYTDIVLNALRAPDRKARVKGGSHAEIVVQCPPSPYAPASSNDSDIW